MLTLLMVFGAPILVAVGLVSFNRARARNTKARLAGETHSTGWLWSDSGSGDFGGESGGDCGDGGGGDGGCD